ncbi:hypothetical protein B7494_g7670 [Chlorociboria aeruginascens]|nr:hypothetical protein B7494_g7670 [Chlorociboria aeruginascens]
MGNITSGITETDALYGTITVCTNFYPTTSDFPSFPDLSPLELLPSTFATVTSEPLTISTFSTVSGDTSMLCAKSEGTIPTLGPTIAGSSYISEETSVTVSIDTLSLQETSFILPTGSFGSSSSLKINPSDSFTIPNITSLSAETLHTNLFPTISATSKSSYTESVPSTIARISSIPTPVLSCDPSPTNFRIGVLGGVVEQWLAEVNVPGGDSERYFGYQELPLVAENSDAAIFSVENDFLKSRVLLEGTATDVYAAVRAYALGNSVVQLFPSADIESDMLNYTVTIDPNTCQLTLAVPGDTTDTTSDCNGVLAVLSPRHAISRGSNCTAISLYAIPYTLPDLPSLSAEPALPTATPGSCALAQNFIIVVSVEGSEPLYLYDQIPTDDSTLSLTSNSSQSLVFSLTSMGQLSFSITDVFGNDVTLISEQDAGNAGNEAIFFTTSAKFSTLDYQPVVATLNLDCSLSLLLPLDGAEFLATLRPQIREGVDERRTVSQEFEVCVAGAVTTVLATVGKEWKDREGRYLENCEEAPCGEVNHESFGTGFVRYIYDQAKEERLWRDLVKIVGMEDDM